MRFDLPFCFRQETQAPGVSKLARNQSYGIRSGIPQRIQGALSSIQLEEAAFRPRKVIALFAGCVFERRTNRVVPASQRLPPVKRLRADLPAMVHPHQASAFVPLAIRQFRHRKLAPRHDTNAFNGDKKRAQSLVELDYQPIDQAIATQSIISLQDVRLFLGQPRPPLP